MAKVSTYLNFERNTEEAFNFYRGVFGGEFVAPGIMRMGDAPPLKNAPPLSEEDRQLVMHMALPILGGHVLMGTDVAESMGFRHNPGNNVHINLEPDTRAEAAKLFDALSEGGTVSMPLQDTFLGAYFGICTDRFGVQWMINCVEEMPA
ncbi:MAG: VOC family protein [Deltaproteobacteria bacterium]|nr:VOC family protein [Deltaproteobacteria bacterium]